MNHMIHIAAISQIRLDTEGRAYYRRERAAGKTKLEAIWLTAPSWGRLRAEGHLAALGDVGLDALAGPNAAAAVSWLPSGGRPPATESRPRVALAFRIQKRAHGVTRCDCTTASRAGL